MLGHTKDFQRSLLSWYTRCRRDLPWRVAQKHQTSERPDPYYVLVSEAMLQQTQVATVIPYFNRFMAAYPTLRDLAAANEQEVLRLWQGLGYYSRARCLLATAKILVEEKNAQIPSTVQELLELPGIGRYTAGAIASLAFETRAPILDGNVARVLSRLDLRISDKSPVGAQDDSPGRKPWVSQRAKPSPVGAKELRESLWRRAEEILPQKRVGDFNSALMELGATICTPRAPKCLLCPVQKHCAAFAAGVAEQIPPPPQKKIRPIERRWILAICKDVGQECPTYLIEQRPPRGRWAGLWQFITIEANPTKPTAAALSKRIGLKISGLRPLGSLRHNLTHRRYEFEVLACRATSTDLPLPQTRRWVGLEGLSDFPLSRPQLQVAQMVSSIIRR